MDDIKKKVAATGMAVAMAGSLSGNVLDDTKVLSDDTIGYEQELPDEYNNDINVSDNLVSDDNSYDSSLSDEPVTISQFFNVPLDSVSEFEVSDDKSLDENDSSDKEENNDVKPQVIDNILDESVPNIVDEQPVIEKTLVDDYSKIIEEAPIVVPNVLSDDSFTAEDYDYYSLMQDACFNAFSRFNSKYPSLSAALEDNYNVQLTQKQRDRYDRIMSDTYKEYMIGIYAYELGQVDLFRSVCERLNGKEFLNLDDLIDILSININSQEVLINDSSNYTISKDSLTIDGCRVESMLGVSGYVDRNNFMSLISFYDGCSPDDLRVLNILQVPSIVSKEATNPSSFSLCVNGTFYSYDNNQFKDKLDSCYSSLCSLSGYNGLGYEIVDDRFFKFYGLDSDLNKTYLDQNSPYYRFIGDYFIMAYNGYLKSKDGNVGYFDGQMVRDCLQNISSLENDNVKTMN